MVGQAQYRCSPKLIRSSNFHTAERFSAIYTIHRYVTMHFNYVKVPALAGLFTRLGGVKCGQVLQPRLSQLSLSVPRELVNNLG
jgi:hypothetical protein